MSRIDTSISHFPEVDEFGSPLPPASASSSSSPRAIGAFGSGPPLGSGAASTDSCAARPAPPGPAGRSEPTGRDGTIAGTGGRQRRREGATRPGRPEVSNRLFNGNRWPGTNRSLSRRAVGNSPGDRAAAGRASPPKAVSPRRGFRLPMTQGARSRSTNSLASAGSGPMRSRHGSPG